MEVGGRDEVGKVKGLVNELKNSPKIDMGRCTHIFQVEGQGVRCSLGSRPEWCPVRVDLILRQIEKQLLDLIPIVRLILHPGPLDTLGK